MKKEIIVSDINFLNPEKDIEYSDNIIRNLLGNYYFVTGDKKYLWNPNNVENAPETNNKLSLASSEQDIVISSNENENKEIISLLFKMSEWNMKSTEQTSINTLQAKINNLLAASYYYGLSKTKNDLPPFKTKETDLTESYGKYFYDYSLVLPTPVVTNFVGQKYINESLAATSYAKILPIYNYYDKNFEEIAAKNKEQSLFNYYTLYYYLLENLGDKKENFLNKNVLPLLKNYGSFVNNYLQSDNTKEKLVEKLEQFKTLNTPETLKNVVVISPDALKLINDLDSKKSEQPFGIDISFAPQPKKTIGSLLSNTSYNTDIEKFVVNKQIKNTIDSKAFAAEIFFNNQNKQFVEEYKEIPIINLNDWIKKVEPLNINLDNDQTIVFSKNEKDKDSVFLQKVKKVLLQKKIVQLIKDKKRTFLEIISGAPAYNEVLLYEIIKYANNQPIQSILLPNTEEIDFYKYFDTQVKYDTYYTYNIKAWTLIIGNKYKYFDRVESPPEKKIYETLKNSTFEDSEYFRWFRVMHTMSTLLNIESEDGPFNFFFSNQGLLSGEKNLFGGATDIQGLRINFSKTLYESYTNDSYVNTLYKDLFNSGNIKNSAATLIDKVKNDFVNLLMKLLIPNKKFGNSDISYGVIQYQTFKAPTVGIPKDVKGDLATINNKQNYFSESFELILENDIIYKTLELFVNAKIFDAIDYNFVQQKIESIQTSQKTNKLKLQKTLKQYLIDKFIINVEGFLDGGFTYKSFNVPLDQPENFNYGLDINSNYYPRFYAKKDNNNLLNGHLQFGVMNEPDIILAGLPYINKTQVKVISSPPAPPEITVIPYKNVKDKIKFFISDSFFTYRDYPIYMTQQDTVQYDSLLQNEKIKYPYDGKITFSGDEPSALFGVYKLEEKPKLYSDFLKGKISLISPVGGGFEDIIQPNKKYYYTFRSVDNHAMASNPSAIYEIEIVENSGAIYPIIKIVELYQEDNRTKNISIKDKFKIDINKEHILQKDAMNSALDVQFLNKFGSLQPSVFGKNFKIRITSKSTKKKIDINLTFTKQADLSLVKEQISSIKKKIQSASKKTKV